MFISIAVMNCNKLLYKADKFLYDENFSDELFKINKYYTQNNNNEYNRFYKNKIIYDSKVFENTSKMNFSVCGLGNDDSLHTKDAKIII